MYKKISLFLVAFLIFFHSAGFNFQNKSKKKDVELVGKIELKTDYWKRRIFKGKVKNISKNRLDFIRIDFEMFNKKNELIIKEGTYIKGSRFVFGDATESMSSLKPGAAGSFEVFTSVPADSINRFKYDISYKYFKYR